MPANIHISVLNKIISIQAKNILRSKKNISNSQNRRSIRDTEHVILLYQNKLKLFTMKTSLHILLSTALLLSIQATSQNENVPPSLDCRTSEVMTELFNNNPTAKYEQEQNELFTQNYVSNNSGSRASYTIPVVFHVYGTTQNGKPVNETIIKGALADLNKDFQGLNSDFGLVHDNFKPIRGTMNITFALALKDPNGNSTNGVIVHPVKNGYGNGSGYDSQIAADAWDNYKYMNVYIQADLYNDGGTTNSGVAWYPSTTMSNNKTARVVYNGQYLGNNTSSEFRSVLTHEFGHWLNLAHTFDGNSCTGAGDNVSDTPPHTSTNLGCHSSATSTGPQQCGGLVNVENYMDYNGAYSCYRMFTKGQITRMDAALQLPSRVTLWQTSNLIATGLLTGISTPDVTKNSVASVYPNPSQGNFTLEISTDIENSFTVELHDLVGNKIGSYVLNSFTGTSKTDINIQNFSSGIYFIVVYGSDGFKQTVKLVKE